MRFDDEADTARLAVVAVEESSSGFDDLEHALDEPAGGGIGRRAFEDQPTRVEERDAVSTIDDAVGIRPLHKDGSWTIPRPVTSEVNAGNKIKSRL